MMILVAKELNFWYNTCMDFSTRELSEGTPLAQQIRWWGPGHLPSLPIPKARTEWFIYAGASAQAH